MRADRLITGISQLATAKGRGARHGASMRDIAVIEDASLAIADGLIAWVGRSRDWVGDASETVDVGGQAVVPGLVDPHTHSVWAGDRLADFDARTSGRSYEEILKAGGGIRSSIRATASASREELVRLALPRIEVLLRSGATTIEIKSGYGFDAAAEIKMLEVIGTLRGLTRAKLVSTLLIHIPPEDTASRARYVEVVCSELIPEVAKRGLARAVDVFVEREAWRADEAETMFCAAQANGLQIKLHSEQFQRVGGLELGVRMGALSIDHLEACAPEQLGLLAGSETVATVLPGVSLHLGIAAAPGRQLIDAGAAVAVGTDLNPGSSPLYSAAAALGLAVRLNGLTAGEALVAGTINAAATLGLHNVGRLEQGMEADFLVLEGRDWRELLYTLGANPVREVWVHGTRV
jgi:imidazolonepropionase